MRNGRSKTLTGRAKLLAISATVAVTAVIAPVVLWPGLRRFLPMVGTVGDVSVFMCLVAMIVATLATLAPLVLLQRDMLAASVPVSAAFMAVSVGITALVRDAEDGMAVMGIIGGTGVVFGLSVGWTVGWMSTRPRTPTL